MFLNELPLCPTLSWIAVLIKKLKNLLVWNHLGLSK